MTRARKHWLWAAGGASALGAVILANGACQTVKDASISTTAVPLGVSFDGAMGSMHAVQTVGDAASPCILTLLDARGLPMVGACVSSVDVNSMPVDRSWTGRTDGVGHVVIPRRALTSQLRVEWVRGGHHAMIPCPSSFPATFRMEDWAPPPGPSCLLFLANGQLNLHDGPPQVIELTPAEKLAGQQLLKEDKPIPAEVITVDGAQPLVPDGGRCIGPLITPVIPLPKENP